MILFPMIIAVLGMAIYLLSDRPKLQNIGYVLFAVGMLCTVSTFSMCGISLLPSG